MTSDESARETDDTLSEPTEQTVYVATKTTGTNADRLHTDEDCPRLESARKVAEKPRSACYDDAPVCKWCRGVVEQPNTEGLDTTETRRRLESMSPEDLGLSPHGERGGSA